MPSLTSHHLSSAAITLLWGFHVNLHITHYNFKHNLCYSCCKISLRAAESITLVSHDVSFIASFIMLTVESSITVYLMHVSVCLLYIAVRKVKGWCDGLFQIYFSQLLTPPGYCFYTGQAFHSHTVFSWRFLVSLKRCVPDFRYSWTKQGSLLTVNSFAGWNNSCHKHMLSVVGVLW